MSFNKCIGITKFHTNIKNNLQFFSGKSELKRVSYMVEDNFQKGNFRIILQLQHISLVTRNMFLDSSNHCRYLGNLSVKCQIYKLKK